MKKEEEKEGGENEEEEKEKEKKRLESITLSAENSAKLPHFFRGEILLPTPDAGPKPDTCPTVHSVSQPCRLGQRNVITTGADALMHAVGESVGASYTDSIIVIACNVLAGFKGR